LCLGFRRVGHMALHSRKSHPQNRRGSKYVTLARVPGCNKPTRLRRSLLSKIAQGGRHILNYDANATATHFTIFTQLLNHIFNCAYRDRKANPIIAAGARHDRCVPELPGLMDASV